MGVDERSIVLILLLVMAGCQPKPTPQSPGDPKSAQAKANTQPQSQPVTPQSIVKDLFPGAPEKVRDAECFRSLKPEMSVYAVVQKCGRPDEEVGSGVYVFLYHLQDGSRSVSAHLT